MGATKELRVFFMDEARFGRMMEPCRCWAPEGMRPEVAQGWVREYTYAYAAVEPISGAAVTSLAPTLDNKYVGHFLEKLSRKYPDDELVLVWDGAKAHCLDGICQPENLWIIQLPPYSPRLNPVENFWAELREKYFHNRLFDSMEQLKDYLKCSLKHFTRQIEVIQSLAGFGWIVNTITSNAI
jgi:transposase